MAEIFRAGHCDANESRVKRLVSLCAGAQIKKLPCLCAGQLQRVEKVQPSWAFLRLYDKMVLGDERCWNAEKWIAES